MKKRAKQNNYFPMQVAGTFYPEQSDELSKLMNFCANKSVKNWDNNFNAPFKAIIMPHAGLRFSGMVAHSAISSVAHLADKIKRIVVLAPTHHLQFSGIATLEHDGFETPFGTVSIDKKAVAQALKSMVVQVLPKAFDGEHSIEVELPFFAQYFPKASIVPLIIGDANLPQMVEVLKALWGGDETLIVISSDLSHFLAQAEAKNHDAQTASMIETQQFQHLTSKHACGFRPVATLLAVAQEKGLRVTQLDVRTSGDTFGNLERVVGYGAWGLEPARSAITAPNLRAELLRIAKQAITHGIKSGKPPELALDTFPFALRTIAKSFVTLKLNDKLRGCIGSMQPFQPLVKDVLLNSFKAAFQDPRFTPIQQDELKHIEISISILSQPTALKIKNEADVLAQLQPDVDGLIIRAQGKQAIFLPSVWEDIHHPRDFLYALKRKAGIEVDHFPNDFQAFVYTAEKF